MLYTFNTQGTGSAVNHISAAYRTISIQTADISCQTNIETSLSYRLIEADLQAFYGR